MICITRAELDGAVRAGIVSAEQADKLAAYLGAEVATAEQPHFTFVHVLYYLGGMIAIGAIWLGVLWQQREAQLSARLRGFLPAALRELIEARAVR
jgi:hypothetical protein